ncbi:hypothetical protein FOA52_009251, partial [Chlamydomonas sp. UWO 241]
MAMYIGFKDKGIEFAKQAVSEDEQGNYEKAWQLYCSSLEYFNAYLKYEKNEKLKASVMSKCKEYIDRAEYLKGISGQDHGGENGSGPTAAQKVRKPGVGGGGKDDDDKEKEKLKAGLTGAILSEKPNVK